MTTEIQKHELKLMTLEEKLIWLSKYGRPKLSQLDSGKWWARIDMYVVAIGATFEVKSDSDKFTSPILAINQLIDRVNTSISNFR